MKKFLCLLFSISVVCVIFAQHEKKEGLPSVVRLTAASTNSSAFGKIVIPDGTVTVPDEAYRKRDDIAEVQLPPSIRHLGDNAFLECTRLKSINLPEGLLTIGQNCFNRCSALEEITIPSTVTDLKFCSFYRCTSLRSLSFVKGNLTKIHEHSFGGCTALTSVEIPDGVKEIGAVVFSDCKNLERVRIPQSVTVMGDRVFEGCPKLPKFADGQYESEERRALIAAPKDAEGVFKVPLSVRYVDSYAFSDCKNMTQIIIPEEVFSLGGQTFLNCERLEAVNIPAAVRSLGYGMFMNCKSLKEIVLPESLERIDHRAFAGCSGLQEIRFPASVKMVGDGAFYQCTSLKRIYVDAPDCRFEDYYGPVFMGCPALKDIYVTADVNHGLIHSFYRSEVTYHVPPKFLESWKSAVPLPGKVVALDAVVLTDRDTGLQFVVKNPGEAEIVGLGTFVPGTDLRIPNQVISSSGGTPYTVTSIGGSAFSGCQGVTSIYIPSSVSALGAGAFAFLQTLQKIEIAADNPSYKVVDNIVFTKNGDEIICIPGASISGELVIPDGTKIIANGAFAGCVNLTSLKIPSSVVTIGEKAFQGCTGLVSVEIPASVTKIGINAFQDVAPTVLTSNSIPSGMKRDNLTTLIVPEGRTNIGERAFANCPKLENVTLPSSLKNIYLDAFADSNLIKQVTIPENVVIYQGRVFPLTTQIHFLGKVPDSIGEWWLAYGSNFTYTDTHKTLWEHRIHYERLRNSLDLQTAGVKVEVRSEMKTFKVMAVTYKVTAYPATVKVRPVAFLDGKKSFGNIVLVGDEKGNPIKSTVASNVEHTFTWNVESTWDVKLANVAIAIPVQVGELLPLDLMTIPEKDGHPAMTVSRNFVSDETILNALLWCYADTPEIFSISEGVVTSVEDGIEIARDWTLTNRQIALKVLYKRMGFELLSASEMQRIEALLQMKFPENTYFAVRQEEPSVTP